MTRRAPPLSTTVPPWPSPAVVAPRSLLRSSDIAPEIAGRRPLAVVEARVAALPPRQARDLALALGVLGHPLAAFVTVGVARPFARLATEQRVRLLERWTASRLPVLRTVAQGVRRLVLASCYAEPSVTAAIGYRGPLHPRAAAVAWEGAAAPLAGHAGAARRERDAEPVLRAATDAERPVLHRAVTATAAEHARAHGAAHTSRPADGDILTADVVVIGSGAGGAVAAARLAERGLDVVVLERGPWCEPGDFTEREGEMVQRLYAEQGLRATDDLGVMVLQGESVGGSTTVNWLVMLRTPDHVLDEWTQRHGTGGPVAGRAWRRCSSASSGRRTRPWCPTTRTRCRTGCCSTARAGSGGAPARRA